MESKELFENTPPIKLFFKAALPGSIGMLASAVYQFFEGIFVGRFLGDTAFAALNLAMPFVIINFAIADLVGVGSSVPISISLGEKNKKAADNYFTCANIMVTAAGAVAGALFFIFAPLLIKLMGATGDFALHAVRYIRVYALFSPVTTIVFAMDNYLRICGKIRKSMFLNIFMALLTILLDVVFLVVLKFDIRGAALATCISMFIVVVICFIPFFRGKMLLRYVKPEFSLTLVRKIVVCGAPNFLNNIAGRITSIVINRILVYFSGETAVSVYGILMYIEGFIQPLLYGMCDSLQPAVGYNWGAGKFYRVRKIEQCCFAASALLSFLSFAVIILLPRQLTSLFADTSDSALLSMSMTALWFFSFTYITRWFSFAVQSYMLAIGESVRASVISISFALIFPLILIAVFWNQGLEGIWMNFPLTSFLTGIEALCILASFKKKPQH